MTLTLLLTSSGGPKPVEAAASASTTLTAELRSQTVRPVAECNVFFNSSAELRKSIEVAAAVLVSSASIAAELRNGTERAASIVALSSIITAGLASAGPTLSSAIINSVSTVTARLPGRQYGPPVTVGSSRSGAGGTPTPGTGR